MTAVGLSAARRELPAAEARAIIRRHSASFSLASRLLEPEQRRNAHALYAYCRRADDAIDLVAPAQARTALGRLREELDAIYGGRHLAAAIPAELQRLVVELGIPREYLEALLRGFELDVTGATYRSMADLHHYCWCVAGSVGAMMCHVLGAREAPAIVHGAHLGMAMQLTNICRDVAEDWARGRNYLPEELLSGLEATPAWPPSEASGRTLASAVLRLLDEADLFYASADQGLSHLGFRARIAVTTARQVYSSIGRKLRAAGADVTAGRVVVPLRAKLWCVARAAVNAALIRRLPRLPGASHSPLRFPQDVLPL
jgi:15-cis-phytoene synthase